MGRRGPAPKPTAIKIAQGNPGKRALNDKEPPRIAASKTPPKHLNSIAKYCYKDLAQQLDDLGVLSRTDARALELLAATYAEWREALDFVKTNGFTFTVYDQGGNELHKRYPQVAIMSDAQKRLTVLMRDFGLTPASRQGVKGEREEVDPLEDFLNSRP